MQKLLGAVSRVSQAVAARRSSSSSSTKSAPKSSSRLRQSHAQDGLSSSPSSSGDAEEQLKGASDAITQGASSLALSTFSIVKNVGPMTITFSSFLWAILFIAAGVALIAIAVYLLAVSAPRIPRPTRSVDLAKYMNAYLREVLIDVHALRQSSSGSVAADVRGLLDELVNYDHKADPPNTDASGADSEDTEDDNDVLKRDEKYRRFRDHLRTYFTFYHQLRRKKSWFSKKDMRENAATFRVKGNLEEKLVDQYHDDFWLKMQKLILALSAASEGSHKSPAFSASLSDSDFDAVTHLHHLRLLLSYRDDLVRMHATRRPNMPLAIWTVYYEPYVKDVFEHRIPDLWQKVPDRFTSSSEQAMRWWNKLGRMISMIPCYLAFQDPAEREQHCAIREEFGAGDKSFEVTSVGLRRVSLDKEEEQEETEETEKDVVEGFGFLKNFIKDIGNLIKNFVQFAKAFGKFVSDFTKNPFKAIVKIVGLIIGVAFGLLLMVVYIFMTFTLIFWLLVFVYASVMSVGLALVLTLLQVCWVIFLALVFFLLWIPDMISKGKVVALMRCENIPDAWAETPGYAYRNAFERMGIVCISPCSSRYRLALGGLWCMRQPGYLPAMCPQQQIYRLYSGRPLSSPYAFQRFQPTYDFSAKTAKERQRILVKAFRDKVKWYQRCYDSVSTYDYLNRHICSNIDQIAKVRGLTDEDKNRLRVLCKECYCEYRSNPDGGRGDDKRAVFMQRGDPARPTVLCSKLEKSNVIDDDDSIEGPAIQLLRRVLTLAMVTVCVLLVFYSLVQASDEMLKTLDI